MKQVLNFFIVAAAIAAGFTSCSSEEAITNPPATQERSNLTIVLNNGVTTKAVVDGNAATVETTVSTISVFIFGSATKAETDTIFDLSKTTNAENGDNKYKVTVEGAPIGTKQVYVGVNLTRALHDAIATSGVSAAQAWADLDSLKKLSPATGGFPMFSDGTESVIAPITVAGPNEVKASVKRLVAKVTVQTDAAFESTTNAEKRTANGMTLEPALQFALGQLNTKAYPYPQVGNVDPNYDGSATYQGDFINEFPITFKGNTNWNSSTPNIFDGFKEVATVAKAGNIEDYKPGYALENTHAKKIARELTYVAIKANFKPEFLYTYTNANLDRTAYANESLPKLYVFNNGGQFLYFLNQAEADAYATDSQLGYETYIDGICFYTVYLNPKDYNVLRNEYYKLTIKDIKKIGKPYPEPSNPNDPLDAVADITIDITVKAWELASQDVSLGEDN
ncbi:MAG: Mfa1 family fimbria major subunit [Tannerellaceae bacterium]|jgi:hypothetical protein|nr:Mfa1 family fimbria major subunit [Tannerellaceae bacterium]